LLKQVRFADLAKDMLSRLSDQLRHRIIIKNAPQKGGKNENIPKVIKRYSNRKLYDTQDSCYVTLEDVAEMIRQGEDIQVLDNSSKNDCYINYAGAIIFEEQKETILSSTRNIQTADSGRWRSIKEFVQKTLDQNRNLLSQRILF
jgi:polyhydroxyalkanoate synthesis repressor PhaR